eukprot:jgi/Ulvmu1/11744/UM008_0157.1
MWPQEAQAPLLDPRSSSMRRRATGTAQTPAGPTPNGNAVPLDERASPAHASTLKWSPDGATAPAQQAAHSAAQPPTLVLGHAINMASAAMQAYLEPAAGAPFQLRSALGTSTQFMSADFVLKHFSAVLTVTVHTANGFEGADWFSDPDLCIEVSAGESYATSSTKKNTLDPVWDETLLLWPEEHSAAERSAAGGGTPQALMVRVYDADTFGRELLGCGEVPLGGDWHSMSEQAVTVEIRKGKGGDSSAAEVAAGTVTLTISTVALTEAAQLEGMRHSAQSLSTATSGAAPQEPLLQGAVSAADVFAAVHQPPLQIAAGASTHVRNSITASVALDPELSLTGPSRSLSITRPAVRVPVLAAQMSMRGGDHDEAAVRIDEEEAEVDVPDTVAEGLEQAEAGGATTASMFALRGAEEVMGKLTDAWAALRAEFPDAFLLEGAPVAFIDAPTCTQVVVAFRGTESMRDWRTDAAALFATVAADPDTGALRTRRDVGPRGRRGLSLGPLNMFFRPMVHSGFYNAYKSVAAQVRSTVDLCTGGDPAWSVTTTGHSLGGALAAVCAYDLAVSRDFPHAVDSYTFGSPRVGNGCFARAYARAVPRTFRMLNTLDIVPQLPPLLLYSHVGHECRLYSATGRLALPCSNPLSVFGGPAVAPTTRDAVLRKLGMLDHSNAVLGRFSRFLRSIFSGKFVRNHLGDQYIDSLCDVMLAASVDAPEASRNAVRDLRDALLAFQLARAENK